MTAARVPNESAPRRRPPAWVLPIGITVFAALNVAGWIANSAWASWHREHPLALIMLNPINRNLILTSNSLDLGEYLGVGLVRHVIPDPVFYAVGYWYGARALKWIAEGTAFAERLAGPDGTGLEDPRHRRILYPLAFLMPNNWVSAFCGSARIPIAAFLVINFLGTTVRLLLCRWVAALFSDEVKSVSDWIARFQWPITVISIACVLATMAYQLRAEGTLRQMAHLDDPELDGPEPDGPRAESATAADDV